MKPLWVPPSESPLPNMLPAPSLGGKALCAAGLPLVPQNSGYSPRLRITALAHTCRVRVLLPRLIERRRFKTSPAVPTTLTGRCTVGRGCRHLGQGSVSELFSGAGEWGASPPSSTGGGCVRPPYKNWGVCRKRTSSHNPTVRKPPLSDGG